MLYKIVCFCEIKSLINLGYGFYYLTLPFIELSIVEISKEKHLYEFCPGYHMTRKQLEQCPCNQGLGLACSVPAPHKSPSILTGGRGEMEGCNSWLCKQFYIASILKEYQNKIMSVANNNLGSGLPDPHPPFWFTKPPDLYQCCRVPLIVHLGHYLLYTKQCLLRTIYFLYKIQTINYARENYTKP